MQESGPDDRRMPRWQVDGLECKVYIGGQWRPASIIDVSLTGLSVQIDLPEDVRQQVPEIAAVLLADPHAQPPGRVVLEIDTAWWNVSRGMGGLRFVGINGKIAQQLHALIVPHIAEGQQAG